MNVLSSVTTLKKKVVSDGSSEREEMAKQIKELKEKITQLEQDNDTLVSENLALQEQLEEEKRKNLELCQARVEDKKAQLAALQEEEQSITAQKEILKVLCSEVGRLAIPTTTASVESTNTNNPPA